jgi:hypothetical protein
MMAAIDVLLQMPATWHAVRAQTQSHFRELEVGLRHIEPPDTARGIRRRYRKSVGVFCKNRIDLVLSRLFAIRAAKDAFAGQTKA